MKATLPRTATQSATLSIPWGWLVVGALTVLFGAVNWHWLQANVVTYGWDRMDHLITSLAYNDTLRTITPQSLFATLSFADYYPPLVHLVVVAAYKIFGVSEDIAVMTNVLYLAMLLAATWRIAKRVGSDSVATLATVILGTFPMIYIMSRYLYLDFALTAIVAVAMALLLESERFQNRGAALWFGLALGLSFWIKWTSAAFLAAPLLFILWRGGILTYLFRHPFLLKPNLKRLVISFSVSAAIMAAWFIPARTQVEATSLGIWLYPIFVLFLGLVIYALLTRTRQLEAVARGTINALSAGAVAAFVIVLWYATNWEFIENFIYTAYGREEGRFWAYGKYLYEVTTEQVGPAYAVAFVVIVAGWLWQKRAQLRNIVTHLDDTAWVLLLWAIVPYIIFSTRVSLAHDRFLMPFLPPFAIWMAVGLWQWRGSVVRAVGIAVILLLAWGQFALLSFEQWAVVRDKLVLPLPTGQVNLLAHGFFIQYPASGDTDVSYHIAPDVLDIAEQARVAQGRETINLGVLVNSAQLHEKHFLYQIYTTYPHVFLRELARNWRDQPAYNQLFEMDYVLVSDTHSYRTDEESREVVTRIFNDQDDLFNRAFRHVRHWTFPSGEHVTLYERRFAPTTPGPALEDYQALLQQWGQNFGAGDALILTAPDQAYIVGLTFPEGSEADFLPLPDGETETIATLENVLATHNRVFLVSHNANQADPNGEIETWLRSHAIAGGEQWFNAVRVVPFVAATLPDSPTTSITATWEGDTQLDGAAVAHTDNAVAAHLFWNAPDVTNRKVSVQLVGADGALLAQQDADLVNGAQDFALMIPRGAMGEARLVVTLYDPATVTRYVTEAGTDVVELEAVRLP